MRTNSPVEFTQYYLFPSPRARDTISFGIDDVLLTAASDSEDFGPSLADALPLSGQEAWPSLAYSELVDVLSRSPVSPALHTPSTRTRMPRALLRGGGCRCFQAFSTPHLRYVFLCTTLCFLYRISFTNGNVYRGYRFGFGPATHFS